MSTPTQPQTGADVMAQFIPSSPFVAKLGIVADVLDADEVRLRLPWDPTNVTVADMVHGGAIAALADVAVLGARLAGAGGSRPPAGGDHVEVAPVFGAGPADRPHSVRPALSGRARPA